uniref:POS2 n=1 Tax=Kalanchoe fedtschenkoi TaxID=63787 RepID=A0A7N0TES8_KALFE
MYPSMAEDGDPTSQKYIAPPPTAGMPRRSPAGFYPPPPPYVPSHLRSRHHTGAIWSTGLCHCCDDPANSLITCCCPCITFGQVAEIIDKGSPNCATHGAVYGLLGMTGCACLYSCFYRSKMRAQYDLEESPCVDCLVHFCCETCALCQEYRELKGRGLDMGIGWEANMERQRRGVITSPAIPQGGMTR